MKFCKQRRGAPEEKGRKGPSRQRRVLDAEGRATRAPGTAELRRSLAGGPCSGGASAARSEFSVKQQERRRWAKCEARLTFYFPFLKAGMYSFLNYSQK